MKREKYSSSDVEQILRELAELDRSRMDDAMTERCLAIIADEVENSSRRHAYKRLLQCAAVLAIMAVGISFFLKGSTDEAAVVARTTPDIEQSLPIIKQEGRELLSHLDASMEFGFSPLPQETYTGRGSRLYGVSVYGNCEYAVCTDTL